MISHRYLKPLHMSKMKFIPRILSQGFPFSANTTTDHAFIQAKNLGFIFSSLFSQIKSSILSILSLSSKTVYSSPNQHDSHPHSTTLQCTEDQLNPSQRDHPQICSQLVSWTIVQSSPNSSFEIAI